MIKIDIPIKLTDPCLRKIRLEQLKRIRRFNKWSKQTDEKFREMEKSINEWYTQ